MRLPLLAQVSLILISAFVIYRQLIPLLELIRTFPLNDFSVYMDGVRHTLSGNPYTQKFFDYYNYPPAATLFFYPFLPFPTDISEFIFTGLSLTSLLLTCVLLFRLINKKPSPLLFLFTFAVFLKFPPTKLTLALGQINLIVLLLIVLCFYFYRKGRGIVSGLCLALAFIFKFTPAVLLLFFLLKKNWKIILSFLVTVLFINLLAILIFGWQLTYYYYFKILPGLFSQTGFYTMQRTYMNQSLTALLGRLGIFDTTHLIVKSVILLPLLYFISRKILAARQPLAETYSFNFLLIFTTTFLPTFSWQHHYVSLLPTIFLLALNNPLLGAISYLLLNLTISPEFPLYAHPLIHSHLFLVSLFIFLIAIFYTQNKKIIS